MQRGAVGDYIAVHSLDSSLHSFCTKDKTDVLCAGRAKLVHVQGEHPHPWRPQHGHGAR